SGDPVSLRNSKMDPRFRGDDGIFGISAAQGCRTAPAPAKAGVKHWGVLRRSRRFPARPNGSAPSAGSPKKKGPPDSGPSIHQTDADLDPLAPQQRDDRQ